MVRFNSVSRKDPSGDNSRGDSHRGGRIFSGGRDHSGGTFSRGKLSAGPMSSGSSLRHLMRLAMLLALVLVLMRSARQTRIYEPFFGDSINPASMVDPATTEIAPTNAASPTNRPATANANAAITPDSAIPDSAIPDSAMLDSAMPDSVAKLDPPAIAAEEGIDRDKVQTIRDNLARVVDGAVFNADDSEAYYGLLDASQDQWQSVGESFGSPYSAPKVAVVPLLQQPDVYRGTMVRVVGQVRRIEKLTPSNNRAHYQMWVRPQIGADRPMVVAVADLPRQLSALAGQESIGPKIDIDLVGVYFKRLAYRSEGGADLAPLIIAASPRSTSTAGAIESASSQPTHRGLLVAGIVAASVIGILIAAIAMRSANSSSDRLRRLRGARSIDTSHLN